MVLMDYPATFNILTDDYDCFVSHESVLCTHQTKRDAWDKMVTLGATQTEMRLTYTEDQQKALRSADKATTKVRHS
ncbi:hypothetical protein CEXT_213031 [Caerostris extrusa]|uniref:Uncharacterized protein n=1 Tax=Caerostris extrusa TaxID=172846 RepID=A0AAV4QJL1_CAEEX|nr:hypothetical protein CEXT_213031 [Caerostris extrusa]